MRHLPEPEWYVERISDVKSLGVYPYQVFCHQVVRQRGPWMGFARNRSEALALAQREMTDLRIYPWRPMETCDEE